VSSVKVCDNCGKVIHETKNPIVAKLYLAPYVAGKTRALHSHYTASMDLGRCCAETMISQKRWVKRKARARQNGR